MGHPKDLHDIFENIVNTTEDFYLVCDRTGRILFVNLAMQDFLGLTSNDFDSCRISSIYNVIIDADHIKLAKLLDKISSNSSFQETLMFQKKNLIRAPLEISIRESAGNLYIHGNKYIAHLHRLQSKYNTEIKNAYRIYQRSLPDSLPTTETIQFAAYYRPAEDIGGDIYDVFKVNHGMLNDFFEQYVVFVCDVTGHGLDSAMLSLFAKETIQSYFDHKHFEGQTLSPKEILQYFVQEYLKEGYPEDYFVCMLLAVFDLKNEEFIYSSAGFQNPPLLIQHTTANLGIEELNCGGMPISSALDEIIMNYPEHVRSISPGMTFLFTTDGMPEQSVAGELYDSRMKQAFLTHAKENPDLIAEHLSNDFLAFSKLEKITDDITLVIAQLPLKE